MVQRLGKYGKLNGHELDRNKRRVDGSDVFGEKQRPTKQKDSNTAHRPGNGGARMAARIIDTTADGCGKDKDSMATADESLFSLE